MHILTETISEGYVSFPQNREQCSVFGLSSILIATFYSPSEPISLHLLCYEPFAVGDHSFMVHASQLQQPRLVNNPG